MGGRGAKMNRTNPYGAKTYALMNGSAAGGGGVAEAKAVITGVAGKVDMPVMANFSQKNIVSFNFDSRGRGGTITIKDDNGRVFVGKFEGAGASRSTYAFKEGFVIKFDKLNGHGFRDQNKAEIAAYKKLPPSIQKRVPEMLQAYNGVKVTNDSGLSRNVDVLIMTKALGGHDTGVKASTPAGRRLMNRARQYARGLENRGVNDVMAFENSSGNVHLHNIYYNGTGSGKRFTLVDIGIGNKALMAKVRTSERAANKARAAAKRARK